VNPTSLSLVPQLWMVLFKRYQTRVEAGESIQALQQEFNACLGYRIKVLNCGGASPIPKIMEWLHNVFSHCYVTENYAATEVGAITRTFGGEAGLIGEETDLILVDSGEYMSTDIPFPRGEICVRTPFMATGYLNRPDLTAAAWDAQGCAPTPIQRCSCASCVVRSFQARSA
jgi:fatty acid CoA ligase FadD9